MYYGAFVGLKGHFEIMIYWMNDTILFEEKNFCSTASFTGCSETTLTYENSADATRPSDLQPLEYEPNLGTNWKQTTKLMVSTKPITKGPGTATLTHTVQIFLAPTEGPMKLGQLCQPRREPGHLISKWCFWPGRRNAAIPTTWALEQNQNQQCQKSKTVPWLTSGHTFVHPPAIGCNF